MEAGVDKILDIFTFLNVEYETLEHDKQRDYIWDGKVLRMYKTDSLLLWAHELGHHMACPPERIQEPEYGLGDTPFSTRKKPTTTMTRKETDIEEVEVDFICVSVIYSLCLPYWKNINMSFYTIASFHEDMWNRRGTKFFRADGIPSVVFDAKHLWPNLEPRKATREME